MLCCVPKRLANGGPFYDEAPFHDRPLFHDGTDKSPLSSVREIRIELFPEEDAPPSILLPCAICARTFMPQSLEKHARICERAAAKKRKPFDSAKQRIQGTELAEFLPKQEVRRHHQDERTIRSSWKKTHDDFLRTIREARGDVMDSTKQYNSLTTSGAPTRANEKGTCPTCNRQFGIKAYDRHVAWCKDRVTRMPMSPATNIAKERLEARMRYRAPTLKNRRAINREKYSPGSAANQAAKASVSSPALVKPKETISSLSCNRESPQAKQKPAVVRRPGQVKDSPTSSGPMKSRLADRMNSCFHLLRPEEDPDSLLTSTSCRSVHLATSSHRSLHFPVSPARPRINDLVSFNEVTSPIVSRKQFYQNETISQRIRNDDARNRETCSVRMQKNIVSARSQGYPRINDVTVNDKIVGMIVQPCKIRIDTQKDGQLVTWKQISHKKDNRRSDDPIADHNFSQKVQLLDLDRLCNQKEETESRNRTKKDSSVAGNNFTRTVDKSKDSKTDKMKDDDITWLDGIQNLNKTYLIKDSDDIEDLSSEIFHGKWKPIKHSPRIEFYLKNKEDAICEFDQKKLKRETMTNNEEIKIEQMKELKVCIENKKDDETVTCTIEELKTHYENIENNQNIDNKEIEVTTCKTEDFDINNKEEHQQSASYEKAEVTKFNIKKIEINTEGTKDIDKTNSTNIVELAEPSVRKEDKEDPQTTMDEGIIESTRLTEETEQKLSESDQLIKSFLFNIAHLSALNVSKNFIDHSHYLIPKDEIECESNICDDSLALQESTVTFTCEQPNVSEIKPLNNSNNQADCKLSPENETSAHQSNSCRNSLVLTKNIGEISFPASRGTVSSEENSRDAEKIEIDEETCENGLTSIIRNKKPRRNSKRLNFDVYSLPQNAKIAADDYLSAPANNTPLHVESNRQFQEKGFSSIGNFENIENNTKDEKADFNTDSDDSCVNDKSRPLGCSIIKTEVTTGEGCRKKNVDSEFDYGSDNTTHVGERNTPDANGLGSSVTLTDYAEEEEESRHCGSETFQNAGVNFPRRASGATRRDRPVDPVEMRHRIRDSMNLLRGSTDSLISSIEFVELASIRRPDKNCAYERETIEIIRPSRRCKVSRNLPDIKNDAAEARGDSERSYWKRTSKISRSRMTSLHPACREEYKLAKRNPRIRILPPVLNAPIINRRKIELETRPAWCNYVRRRPDFNLVLKARTGTCKDYDPFLLAEQQMNDLLSDTSDQSIIGSPKLQQTRDTLYPLSHSSAFVKYPPSDRRSSLIAPPTEFDDLLSNFSSDSTETNSISREVFLKSDLAGKDATDSASSKPIRQLGRRVIIDKSKALGVDEQRGVDERRGVVISADRPHKIFEKDALRSTRSLINRSDSVRVSSAPRINSGPDRKILTDMKKAQGSKIAEGQRSSDQSLNQRNNNYSSLSGSNLSLSSIVSSSEPDIKRSNSMFDELMTSFEGDTFPGLRSFLNNESFNLSSPGGDRLRNGSLISDEELSSPDSYKPQDHSKISNDSAYSSLNRKCSHHGRSANDAIDRLDEDAPRNETSPTTTAAKYKMSKFCHECGLRFPETAKFCCECGVRRLAL
ncbi:uncharacterized protein LOC105833680 [Monomorium pharaonis]|uniref:uncharacterized protein LOC105833680 n=1 Tax=Monomorium pharaonis TaxID=307658 RepID=UPI001747C21B|nr:uncharacterized protein LOC105833680 [Monomorium pharaonis]